MHIEWTEKTPTVCFDDPGGGTILVFPFCPKCGRFVKHGELWTNNEGDNVTLKNWICKRDGEVEPDWTRA